MTAAARTLAKPSAGAAPAGYQGMLTSPDILTTNARDLKVEISSFQFLVFSFQFSLTAEAARRHEPVQAENCKVKTENLSPPVRAGNPAGEVVEGEVLVGEQLGEEDDLPRVHREVFDGVEDGREQRHVEPLHPPRL